MTITNITVSAYRPDEDTGNSGDLQAIFALWQTVFSQTWPLTETLFQAVIANPLPLQSGKHFVARQADRVVGFVATQLNPTDATNSNGNAPPTGWILALLVDPQVEHTGIGTLLLNRAIDALRADGAQRIVLGGRYPRIWPGVPDNLPSSLDFFRARDWNFTQNAYDLVRSLDQFETPHAIRERMAAERITLEAASAADVAEVLGFQSREFQGWQDTYRFVAQVGDFRDFLVARDPLKGIVGTLIMFGAQSNPARVDALWKPLLGASLGGLGEVGVAAAERGRGIGIALVAFGSEILRARGVGMCNIGYTSHVDFYGKLGYQPWQKYHIATRTFDPLPLTPHT